MTSLTSLSRLHLPACVLFHGLSTFCVLTPIFTLQDSEVLLNTFAIFLMKHYTADREQSVGKVTPQMIFRTVEDVMRRCEGGWVHHCPA